MGGSHWLLLIPYYFFGALAFLLLFILLTRIVRLRIPIRVLATTAALTGLAVAVLPVLLGWADLHAYTARRLVGLFAVTGALAFLDACLQPLLPAPLDKELEEL